MIDCVMWETAHLFSDALASQHRLRHRVFVERHGWQVPTYNGMEYDQYDTPAAVCLIWRDNNNDARAAARLIPTDRPYMLQELWPDLVADGALPHSPHVWEGTRLCVDRGLGPQWRQRIVAELLCGCLEFGLRNEIEHYLILAPVHVLKHTYESAGCSIELLGPPSQVDRDVVAAAKCLVSEEILSAVQARSEIADPVLQMAPSTVPTRSAA